MDKFAGAKNIGLKNKETEKLIAVYPYTPQGTDTEITKAVMDWYYKQSCSAEEELRNAYVDLLTDNELKSHN